MEAVEEEWWKSQAGILFVGALCGVMASLVFRRTSPIKRILRRTYAESKMVFLVRSDLSMGKGKTASQVAHAAIILYKSALRTHPQDLEHWENTGQMKVVLKCHELEEFLSIEREASTSGLLTATVFDAGKTQIPQGTRTVLGIGPGSLDSIDRLTGHLKLY